MKSIYLFEAEAEAESEIKLEGRRVDIASQKWQFFYVKKTTDL